MDAMNQKKLPTVVLFGFVCLAALSAEETWEQTFVHPPESARPLTWWHWLDGNITREGITADLEAMKRGGLGGAYVFNAGLKMPQGPVRFLQPQWQEMMGHAIRESARLGIKFGIHNCDGFSQSGGPWITPENSMKELSWTATDVEGGGARSIVLPQPEVKEGFYRDIAVVAFPVPEGGDVEAGGKVGGSLKADDLAKLADGDPRTKAVFPITTERNIVEFVFDKPQTVRSVVFHNSSPHNWEQDFPIFLEVSDDGVHFREAGSFTANWDFDGNKDGVITAACGEVTGKVFRLSFQNPWRFEVGEIDLSGTARVHFAEAKSVRLRSRGHGGETRHHLAYPGPDRNESLNKKFVIPRDAVRNLTGQMDPAGRLKVDFPAGAWRILRVGFTSNGHHVAPATPEGRGLECDKLDPRVVRSHLDQYVGRILALAGPEAGRTLSAVEVDSWECGIQNWTAGLEERFKKCTGYDLISFFPTLLEGWIVENRDVSERVLWDWRRFLADQFAENYFSVIADYSREKGLTSVGESTGRQQALYDAAYAKSCTVPMGEFWMDAGPGQGVRPDTKLSASIAHTTGKPIVAAESFTGSPAAANWQNHPFSLKPLGDRAFCAGINQFVFHTFAHQPYEVVGPGFTFAQWGLNFNRGNTWWESVHVWTDYLARCSEMLRKGMPVSDVLYFIGEDVPNRIGWREDLRPVLPSGYDFDGCDAKTLLEARVKDGKIVLPGGAEYRVLLLPPLFTMRLSVLEKIDELVSAGAVIFGPRPLQSPSLIEHGEGDQAVARLAEKLWGTPSENPVDRTVDRGRVFSNTSFEEVFARLQLVPDFTFHSALSDREILSIHRRVGEAEVYFVSNQKNRPEEIRAVFRVGDRAPEWWDPATGAIRPLPDFKIEGDCVSVPLRLDPYGSGFVVFRGERKPTAGKNWPEFKTEETLSGPWQVDFPPNLGAPASIALEHLSSLSEQDDPGVRFFSGTAAYRKKGFSISHELLAANRSLFLDLGRVEVIAEVILNGKNLGTLWKPPFRVPLNGAAKAEDNELEIRVTNLWPNRMIGDASLPDDVEWTDAKRRGSFPVRWPDWLLEGKPRPSGRVTFCTRREVYTKDDPLLPSGLIGPVTIQTEIGPP